LLLANANIAATLCASARKRGLHRGRTLSNRHRRLPHGSKNDPSRNEPKSPWLTLIGTATWTGARPANIGASGKIGLVGTATQANQQLSLTNLVVEP
jgi:hypothetical protein